MGWFGALIAILGMAVVSALLIAFMIGVIAKHNSPK